MRNASWISVSLLGLTLVGAPGFAGECVYPGTTTDRLAYASRVGTVADELHRVNYFVWGGKNCRDLLANDFPVDAREHLRTADTSWAIAVRAQLEQLARGLTPNHDLAELALREIGTPEPVDEGFVRSSEERTARKVDDEIHALRFQEELVTGNIREWIAHHRDELPSRLFRPEAIEALRVARLPTAATARRALEDWMANPHRNSFDECEGTRWAAQFLGNAAGGAGRVATCLLAMKETPSAASWLWLVEANPKAFQARKGKTAAGMGLDNAKVAEAFAAAATGKRLRYALKSPALVVSQPEGPVVGWIAPGQRVVADSAAQLDFKTDKDAEPSIDPLAWLHVEWLEPAGPKLVRRSGWANAKSFEPLLKRAR